MIVLHTIAHLGWELARDRDKEASRGWREEKETPEGEKKRTGEGKQPDKRTHHEAQSQTHLACIYIILLITL